MKKFLLTIEALSFCAAGAFAETNAHSHPRRLSFSFPAGRLKWAIRSGIGEELGRGSGAYCNAKKFLYGKYYVTFDEYDAFCDESPLIPWTTTFFS